MTDKPQTKTASDTPEVPIPPDQHSPLPWSYSGVAGDNHIMSKPLRATVAIVNGDADREYIVHCVNHAEKLAEACAAYVRARNDGGVSMADLSTIADRKIREALAAYESETRRDEQFATEYDETLQANIQDGNVEAVEDAIDEAMSQ